MDEKTQSDKHPSSYPDGTSPRPPSRGRLKNFLDEHFDIKSMGALRVWVVMALLSGLLIFGGFKAQSRYGLLVGFLIALTLNSLVFFYGDLRLFSLFPSLALEGKDAWGLLRIVREFATRLGLRRPEVHLIQSSVPLLFSAGLLPGRTVIFVSSEMTRAFSFDELRTLLAYEMIRLRMQQTASATAASALAGFIALTASAIDSVFTLRILRSFKRPATGKSAKVAPVPTRMWMGPFTVLTSPLVALIIRLSVTRRDILEADRQTLEFLRTETNDSGIAQPLLQPAEVFARALWKLASYAKTKPFAFNIAEAHLFTVSPLLNYRAWQFASAHPPIDARLKALIGRESF